MDLDVSGDSPKPEGRVGGSVFGGLFSFPLSMAVALGLLHSSPSLEKEIGIGLRWSLVLVRVAFWAP